MRAVIGLLFAIGTVLLVVITYASLKALSPIGATIVLIGIYSLPIIILTSWGVAIRRKKKEAAEASEAEDNTKGLY